MMFLRKSLQAGLVAAIFCQLSSFVESHCFNPDGSYAHPGHYIAECFHPPTTSPAPTASPAPSPSPSEPPSYSLGPSASPAPTTSPTDAPTTSIPSSRPSASPTASPAPSPSPSGIPSASPTKSVAPSDAPTMKPSQSPSDQPSASPSDKPSMNPSQSPTEQPSASPTTSSPSASPTGPITLTVLDLGFVFQNVTGEREMSVQDIAFLESVTTYYLQSHVDGAPGAFSLEVDYAIITDQNLIKFENQTDLLVTIDIVVSAIWNQSESLMLNDFFQEFFAMAEHKKEIRDIVEQDDSFAAGIFVTMATESPTESPTVSSNESSFESSVDRSKSQKKEKKAPNRSAVTGSILAVIAVFVGSWLLWMWMQARKYDETGDLKLWTWIQEHGNEFWKWGQARGNEFWKWSQARGKELRKWTQVRRTELSKWIQARQNGESEDLKLDNVGTISNKSSDSSEDRRLSISNFYPKRDIESAESNENSENSVNDDGRERKSNMVPLMFVPTLLPTESNIEIPDTPGSTVPFSGFETPSSTAGFMNGFATPKSTRSGNFATSKLLGQTPDSEESKAKLPVMPKIPLPPKVLGPPKSPYRRETKARGQIESHDNVSSMYSGVGVVAGKNNRDESDKNNMTQAEMILQDLPMEIGGPTTAPKPAAKLPRPKVVIPTQEDIVFRPPSGRKGSRYAYSPRINPHSRKKKGESTTRSTEKDHSVVDIVDQIAYLYSSNEPEKRTDTDTKN